VNEVKKVKKLKNQTTIIVNKCNCGEEQSLETRDGVMPQQVCNTAATGDCSSAEGVGTRAQGFASHAEGHTTTASGYGSHSEGFVTTASGQDSHAEGDRANSVGFTSHAEGSLTVSEGRASHAEGDQARSVGDTSHAEGHLTIAEGQFSHAEGDGTHTIGVSSHAEGFMTVTNGFASHAEGRQTAAVNQNSHAEGLRTTANGFTSHAEGIETNAAEDASHAEGRGTIASGFNSHSEGFQTRASGDNAHSEGRRSMASGFNAHAEGNSTTASGINAHAEGFETRASGNNAHAEGRRTLASGANSHAEGHGTSTAALEGAYIIGRFGDATDTYSWHLANGTSDTNRNIAAIIRNDGRGIADNGWVTGNADFAEMFETIDGKPIEPGYFVTLEGKKIKKVTQSNEYAMGITTSAPAFLADAGELRWKDKYLTDEFGSIQYHEVTVPAVKDKKGNIVSPERKEMQPILNPKWDNKKEYIPRSQREEWVPVALMGKVVVRDDGTCKVNGYCMPTKDGIATSNWRGYRVLERVGKNLVVILFVVSLELD
jgi:trimeric autotransporter adhesin